METVLEVITDYLSSVREKRAWTLVTPIAGNEAFLIAARKAVKEAAKLREELAS